MTITNLQIRKTLQYAPIALVTLVLADMILIFIPEFFGGVKVNGYLSSLILLSILAFYAYVGYPMFSFDSKGDYLKIRSHLALSTLFGKKLRVPKRNIMDLKMDISGVRDKLIVAYLNNKGAKVEQRFSITILSRRKKAMLQAAVDEFARERSAEKLHLFI